MLIDEQGCTGCAECVPYCTVGAIEVGSDGIARVDLDGCVECGSCLRAEVCPTNAIYQQPLEWPRTLRAQFSNPVGAHPSTGIPGRGTEEIKTNDVTGRVRPGFASVAVELGRPGVGTRLSEVEKIAMALSRLGLDHERANPITHLMTDKQTGKMREDVLREKVLSAIVEVLVPQVRVVDVLLALKEIASQVDTVFCVDLGVRYQPDGSVPIKKTVEEAGFALSLNGKVNIGMVTCQERRREGARR